MMKLKNACTLTCLNAEPVRRLVALLPHTIELALATPPTALPGEEVVGGVSVSSSSPTPT